MYQVGKSAGDEDWIKEKRVRVKLTGDGTNIGRKLHVVAFAFTILEEGAKAYGPAGNHCIAILKEPEKYESMKQCLKDIIEDVGKLESITIGECVFKITLYLGGDWKFLAMATGIDSATSTHACIWFECPALERFSSSQEWSISDSSKGARTIEENIAIAQSKRPKFNVSRSPLFPMIPLTRVVVDNLHMFLRVSDVCTESLLFELRRLDCFDKSTKLKNLSRLNYLKRYESTLHMLGITGYEFWIGKESKVLKYRTLTSPEKLKLFTKISIADKSK